VLLQGVVAGRCCSVFQRGAVGNEMFHGVISAALQGVVAGRCCRALLQGVVAVCFSAVKWAMKCCMVSPTVNRH